LEVKDMKLWDLFNMDLYREMVIEKYVRINRHPTLPLSILGYTEKAQFEGKWNEVTKQCRGLIVDNKLNVIARPFDKFMNFAQDLNDSALMDFPVEVTDKMDGSLGIIFHYENDWHVATRGSFTSDQAIWATDKYRKMRINSDIEPWIMDESNWTYLVEIIYPANRIVLDYGDLEALVLLGARNIHTGLVRPPKDVREWRGRKTQVFPYKTLLGALTAPPRPNAEGFVVYFPDFDYRIKIKQEDYILLHKIVTGLTSRRIWENMKSGQTLSDLMEIVPDEWHDWLHKTYQEINDSYLKLSASIWSDFHEVINSLPEGFTRNELALAVLPKPNSGLIFALYDNKDIREKLWKMVRPGPDQE
jgi:RNA ligase